MAENIANNMNIGGNRGSLSALFGTTPTGEMIKEIELAELEIHPQNPYLVESQNSPTMKDLTESIRSNGIQNPLIVRPHNNGYQIISGHRRYFAATYAGKTSVPCIVREMDDDSAIIVMCDANLQRSVTRMEQAKALRVKLQSLRSLNHEDRVRYAEERLTKDIDPDGSLLASIKDDARISELAAKTSGLSSGTVKRLDRLNELTPELQEKVSDESIPMSAAVELSYLPQEEQSVIADSLGSDSHISIKQAKELRSLSENGNFDAGRVATTLNKPKQEFAAQEKHANDDTGIFIARTDVEPLFMLKGDFTNQQMHDKMVELVVEWSRQQADTSYTIFSDEIENAGIDMTGCESQGRTRDCVAAVAQIFSRFGQRLADAPLLYEALCSNEKLMTAVAPHFEAIKAAMDTCLAEAPVGKKPRF